MNFLQLCRAVATESGTVAGVPNFTTTVGAQGRVAKVVGWVRDAYIDIQNERPDWRWMRRDFTAALTIGKMIYTPAELGLSDVARWLPDIPAEGFTNFSLYEAGKQEQEGPLPQIEYPLWRERYQRGAHDANKSHEVAITPQNALAFGNKPDKAYIVQGEYRQTPQELMLDTDVPEMPVSHHRIIIGEALRLMARSDEAFQVLAVQAQQYERFRNPLVLDQTPTMSFGGGTFA